MERQIIKRKETERVLIVVTKNTIKDQFNFAVKQTSKRNGVEFDNSVFDTKRKLNNYLKRFELKV